MSASGVTEISDEHGYPLDRIRLVGLTATGHHGVFDHERVKGQVFRVDLVIHGDTRPAAASDDLSATVDYGVIAQAVTSVLSGEPVDLIETLAERIAATVLSHSGVFAVDVTVHKPQAPLSVPFDDVELTIRRSRLRPPVVPAVTPLEHHQETLVPGTAEPQMAMASSEGIADSQPLPHSIAPVLGLLDSESAPQHDRMDEIPDDYVLVVLALGGNIGDVQSTLRQAVTDLDRIPGLEITEVSPLARTAAVGDDSQPDYLNTILLGRTLLSARALLQACLQVEHAHGRVRTQRWAARTLDIDLIVYGTLTGVAEDIELPHPRAHERSFVLEPWSQVDPDAILPGLGGGPVAVLAATAPDRSGIRWLALDWLTEPAPVTDLVENSAAEVPAPTPLMSGFPPFDEPPYTPEGYAPGAEPTQQSLGTGPAIFVPQDVAPMSPSEVSPFAAHPTPVVPDPHSAQPVFTPPAGHSSGPDMIPSAPSFPPLAPASPHHGPGTSAAVPSDSGNSMPPFPFGPVHTPPPHGGTPTEPAPPQSSG